MGVINKQIRKHPIVGILLIVEIMTIVLIYKSYSNRNNTLDEVNMLGKNSGLFAIYIKEQGETDYTRSNNDEFPNGFYELNRVRSGCIDSAGNSLENVSITYEEGEIEVKTNQSVYCYLYFDFNLTASKLEYTNATYTECNNVQCAIDELYDALKPVYTTELVAGLYRYQGTNADNYICFGTNDSDTCTGDTDKYMYRIIGRTSSGQMKLIKKEALNTAYAWHSDSSTNTTWSNSDLYIGLNGSYFLTNTDYVPSGWSNRIDTVSWKYGDFTNANATPVQIATTEQGFTDTVNAKIGLMYIHDYNLAGENNCLRIGVCKPSWLYLAGNDTGAPNKEYEWSMTRYGLTLYYYQAWGLHNDMVRTESYSLKDTASVRPVFYLTQSQVISSGDGTIDNPFILS